MLEKSGSRHDRNEIQTIIDHGYDTMKWLAEHGVPFKLPLNFWVSHQGKGGIQELAPGVPVVTRDYGRGLTDALWATAEKTNLDVFYSMPAHDLITDGDQILGVQASPDGYHNLYGRVILACGGFSRQTQECVANISVPVLNLQSSEALASTLERCLRKP